MHTDDTKNVCDKDGRVLVNVNHPPDEADIFLTNLLARTVKNHQVIKTTCPLWPGNFLVAPSASGSCRN